MSIWWSASAWYALAVGAGCGFVWMVCAIVRHEVWLYRRAKHGGQVDLTGARRRR